MSSPPPHAPPRPKAPVLLHLVFAGGVLSRILLKLWEPRKRAPGIRGLGGPVAVPTWRPRGHLPPGPPRAASARREGGPGRRIPGSSGSTAAGWDCPGDGSLRRSRSAPGALRVRVPFSLQPMARFLTLCTWLLALGPGLLATVRAECSQDCATCSYRLARPTDINPLACTLECEGKLPSLKTWETCKEFLKLTQLEIPQDGTSALRESSPEEGHALAKKYGGFMKRYGGFMKKMDELYPQEPEEEAPAGEILAKRYGGFMKKDAEEEEDALASSSDLLKELLGPGETRDGGRHREGGDDEDVSKSHGGFMRALKGFMRRVGRPEWWMDYQKRYGGFLKRFADSLPSDEEGESYSKEVPDVEKRYRGFTRF
uniref:Proenkephalin-A n=1 Tax=Felis catus TaxID=9685 RepID=A0ABI7XZQ3_FELCA